MEFNSFHDIAWDDKKITRLWDYYSSNPVTQNMYFAKLNGLSVIKHLKSKINLRHKRILDYGCGPGFLLDYIVRLGLDVKYCGLDNSKKSIEAISSRHTKTKQLDKLFYVDAFPSNLTEKFDIILCCEVVEHLSDEHLNSMINEFKAMLNPGGYILITTPNDEDLDIMKVGCPECGCVFHKWQHVRNWNKQSIKAFFEKFGFTTAHVEVSTLTMSFPARVKHFAQQMLSIFGYQAPKPINLIYIGQIGHS